METMQDNSFHTVQDNQPLISRQQKPNGSYPAWAAPKEKCLLNALKQLSPGPHEMRLPERDRGWKQGQLQEFAEPLTKISSLCLKTLKAYCLACSSAPVQRYPPPGSSRGHPQPTTPLAGGGT